MGPLPWPIRMADFSNPLPDPLEVARRRHGFASGEDLEVLERLVALAAGHGGAARLSLGDRGGQWYETAVGTASGSWTEHRIALDGTDVVGFLRVAGADSGAPWEEVVALLVEVLRLRRLGAERRRQPRGPEGASFVPGVVHELRNFLFAMGAGLDAFEIHFGGKADESAHAEALRRNLNRLQGFTEELGEYGNPGSLAFELLPVMPVLEQALRQAEPLLRGRDLQLRFPEPAGASPLERMARPALQDALKRLIELAGLETLAHGTVSVTATLVQGQGRPWLDLSILGVPVRGRGQDRDLDLERLFEPFYYRDKEMSRLGPAIARRLIEAHGGQLGAAWQGDGLMLRVMLPVWMPEQEDRT